MMVDDAAYQQADGMMPYAQARGVMRLRAESHGECLWRCRTPVAR